jgi:hypothetical protein
MTQTIREQVRDAIIDATIERDGAEVTDYAECYLALVQDVQGTLPDGYTIEWGPRSAHTRRVIAEAIQIDDSMWREATAGSLTL